MGRGCGRHVLVHLWVYKNQLKLELVMEADERTVIMRSACIYTSTSTECISSFPVDAECLAATRASPMVRHCGGHKYRSRTKKINGEAGEARVTVGSPKM